MRDRGQMLRVVRSILGMGGLAAGVVAVSVAALSGPVAPSGDRLPLRALPRHTSYAPRMEGLRHGPDTSRNWSGYAVRGSDVRTVKGTWTVPYVSSTFGTPEGASAVFVGIDGVNNETVQQLGTEQDWSDADGANYFAWFEMYPRPGYVIPNPVSPGDNITAEVRYQGQGRFVMTMTNDGASGKHKKWTFIPPPQKSSQAQRTSAEWIVEAPLADEVLPLADFGSVPFRGCEATLGAVKRSLSNWPRDTIRMVSSTNSARVKAQPGNLYASGWWFVSWLDAE